MIPLQELLRSVRDARIVGDPATSISDVVADSRQAGPGVMFAALPGTNTDGALFVQDAIDRGAACILGAREPTFPVSIPVVIVDDPIHALAEVAQELNGRPADHLRIIGTTGTDGKTSVAYLISAMIGYAGLSCAYLGTLGAKFAGEQIDFLHTTPPPLQLHKALAWARERGAQAVSLEASSHALVQRRLEGIQLDAAVFTTFGRDHLDYHGTTEEYLSAKLRIFCLLKPDAPAVLNADQPEIIGSVNPLQQPTISFSIIGHQADLRVVSTAAHQSGTTVRFAYGGKTHEIQSSLLGRFQAKNLAAAASVGIALGLTIYDVIQGLETVSHIPGRFEPIYSQKKLWAIVDYAHTPGALEHALTSARDVTRGRLILVFGCGGERDKGKRRLMGEIASRLADVIVITNDNPRREDPRAIVSDVLLGIPDRSNLNVELDRRAAIRMAADLIVPGDLVLLAGKGHESVQVIGNERLHFNDVEELSLLDPFGA
jgi:UDP-N-acetylmuramoyl-L-alanyl-D-glutamate--2,6-diaminopimelate ligase